MTDTEPHFSEADDVAPYDPGQMWEDTDSDEIPETDPVYDESAEPAVDVPEPPAPIRWSLLSAAEAEIEWYALNEWTHWLRKRYGLPTAVVPPFWHRHGELVEELSALHLHYLGSFHQDQDGSGPMGWHADFDTWQKRMREWVTITGTKLDRDRDTRQTAWPGEPPAPELHEEKIDDREADFFAFVEADLEHRRQLAQVLDELFDDEPARS